MAKQTFTTGQVLTAAQMTSLQETAMGGGAATAKTASYVLVAADAGTTVAMNAAGATTITVNTGLFAAGDTVFIQNLGAGACTVTAGTATVATAGSLILPQNDAGILYFVSTGVSIFYDFIQVGAASPLTTKGDLYGFSTLDARVPIGANGTVLTADSTESLGLKWAAAAAAAFVGCLLTKTANQSISNLSITGITWDSELKDTDSFHNNSTNNTRITIPSGKGGLYLITGQVSYAANATGYRAGTIKKNGTDYYVFWNARATDGEWSVGSVSNLIELVAGDYLQMFTYHNAGTAIDINGGNTYGANFGVQFLGA